MTAVEAIAARPGSFLVAVVRALAPFTFAALIVSAAGCGIPRGGAALLEESEPASAASRWPMVLISAQSDVDQARYAEADRRLREFAAEYAQSAEALESVYWRAVFMLDPANTAGTAREAAGLLERYLSATSPLVHRAEATVFQRLAKNLAAPREEQAAAPARTPDPAREAEIKALKDELEATKAELERIRKRVATPPTTPPPPPLTDAE